MRETRFPRAQQHLFITTSIVGLGGWALLLLGFAYWSWWPVELTTIEEPIPVLNENQEIAVGDPIVLSLEVTKPDAVYPARTERFLVCESGNLVTLTATERDLPTGTFTIIADGVTLPAKVGVGDVCVFEYHVDYQVNPIRVEQTAFVSEPFTVVE